MKCHLCGEAIVHGSLFIPIHIAYNDVDQLNEVKLTDRPVALIHYSHLKEVTRERSRVAS